MMLRSLALAALLLSATTSFADQEGSAEDIPGQTPTSSSTQHRAKDKKDKDDVNTIGTRDVGHRGWANWYSLEYEIRLGMQWSKTVESRLKLLSDPVVIEYVNRVGQHLVSSSDAKVPFTIKVIDDTGGTNTFALPGGFLYVPSGLILAADNEAEMVGILAHEIAHVAAHHAVRQITRENLSQLATTPLALVAGPFGQVIRGGAAIAVPASISKFSRGFEAEADYLGIQYMYKAGYDPHAFITFLERMSAANHRRGTLKNMFSMYPKQSERIRQGEREIEDILPPQRQYIVSTSDFDDVKTRLLKGRQNPKLNEKFHAGPVLRQQELRRFVVHN